MQAKIDISNVVLRTERLTLRPWRMTDDRDLFEYAKVDGVGQMAGWIPHRDILESREILIGFIEGKKTFALEYEGKVIGSLGIELYDQKHHPEFDDKVCREIGYVLSKDYWGRGLMPEAVKEVMRYLFLDVGLDIIFCGRFMWNEQSGRVQQKCGFRHYCYEDYTTKSGKVEYSEYTLITREEWMEQHSEEDR